MNSIVQPGLASIIVPCFNQVEFTRLCIQSLFRHNRRAWELIVVDNGSTDGTADYLAGVRDAAAVPVTIVRNAQNRGSPRRSTRDCIRPAASSLCCSTTTRSSPRAGSISSSP